MLPRILLLPAVFIFAVPSAAGTHPGHYSTSEIEWNAATERFEIAMRLRISDFEDALSLQQKTRVSLESTRDPGKFVRSYLQQHFSITSGNSQSCRLHWVGMELELHDAWIYFEADAAKPVSRQTAHTPDTDQQGITSVTTWGELFGGTVPGESCQSPAVHIRNSVISDVQPEQTNLVTLKYKKNRTTISLSNGKFQATISDRPKPVQ